MSDGRDGVVAQDVRQLDRLGRRRDVLRVERGEDRVLVEDVVELALQARQLLLGQTEAREVGDVLDVGTGERGHARDDTGRDPAGRPKRGRRLACLRRRRLHRPPIARPSPAGRPPIVELWPPSPQQ